MALVTMSCGSSSISDKNAKYSLTELQALATNGNYEIVSTFAYPAASNSLNQIANSGLLPPGSNAAAIDIMGTSNYVNYKDNTVEGYLPFFGERNNGARISQNDNAIQFKETPEAYEVTINEKKQLVLVKFDVKDDSENYTVNMSLSRTGRATMSVQSSERSFMRYSGEVSVKK